MSTSTKATFEAYCEIRESPGKGLGIFAVQDIPKGLNVLTESAMAISIKEPSTLLNVLKTFEALSSEDQDRYLALSHGSEEAEKHKADHDAYLATYYSGPNPLRDPSNAPKELQIYHTWHTNAFSTTTFPITPTPAIFPTAARLNHGCIPNITFSVRSSATSTTWHGHATRLIPAGEELLVDSLALTFQSRAKRHERLLPNYGFVCACAACEDEAGSDRRRAALRDIVDRVVSFCEGKRGPFGYTRRVAALEGVRGGLRLLEEEGFGVDVVASKLMENAASTCKAAGDWLQAVEWAERWWENEIMRLGSTHQSIASIDREVEELQHERDRA